ncbi:MAG: hypothetical protein V2I27_01220 [Erythrobacter sp.]|jgi:uncharacterized membrane protein|nr:hypothetical protein [Erythrobacter sp.]
MIRRYAPLRLTFAIALALPAGCSTEDTLIDSEGRVFDRIAPDAAINLNGTEPFWSLAIAPSIADEGYTATYSTPEDIEGTSFAATRFAGNNGLGFSGALQEQPVQIAITPGECSDGMSDRTYPYTASVRIGETLLEGCGSTSEEPFTGPASP